MKCCRSGLVALALLPLTATAHAADMKLPVKAPPPSPYSTAPAPGDWAGMYLGVNGGIINSDGVLIGGTLGYNFQTGPTVFGIEGDIDSTWANRSAPYLDTIRGRFGYSFDTFMPYLTGGWAYGDHGASGAAYGGGIEFRVMPSVSMKVEYLHVDINGPDDSVRLGLNWHFNMGAFGAPIAARY